MSTEISQGKLEATIAAINDDLDRDESVWPDRGGVGRRSSHG